MQMSVTRALAELKRYDDKLSKASFTSQFVSVVVGKNDKKKLMSGNVTPEQMATKIQSDVDTINSMIELRAKIKAAIVTSNAMVLVTVGGRQMTVAEAIELKSSIGLKKTLVSNMQNQLTAANNTVAASNAKLDQQIETNLATVYGSDKSKIDTATYEAVAKPQRDQKEAALLDPMKISELIEKMSEEISLVETELDFTLSEVNAKTVIEV